MEEQEKRARMEEQERRRKEERKEESRDDRKQTDEIFDFEIPHESGNKSESSSWQNKEKDRSPGMVEVDSDYFAAPEDSGGI